MLIQEGLLGVYLFDRKPPLPGQKAVCIAQYQTSGPLPGG